jgi:hypothetical protein
LDALVAIGSSESEVCAGSHGMNATVDPVMITVTPAPEGRWCGEILSVERWSGR